MSIWQFWLIGGLGICVLILFAWFIFARREKFTAPFLGLLTMGILLIVVSLMQPDSIKYGGVELSAIKKDAEEINSKARESVKLALETTAMLTWNAGKLDSGGKQTEEIATKLLKELYGEKALQYRYALQKRGIYVTPQEELAKIPETTFPREVQSPLYEKYLKNLKLEK